MLAYVSSSIPFSFNDTISCVTMNSNIFCGLENGQILVINQNNEFQELTGHTHKITAIECYDEFLASGDKSGTIIIWKCHNGAYYEEMSNNKINSQITGLCHFSKLLAISYLDGHVIVGSGTGKFIWNVKLDNSVVDCKWWNNHLYLLSTDGLHQYTQKGELVQLHPLNIQHPLKLQFHQDYSDATSAMSNDKDDANLMFLIKTKKSLFGFFQLDNNKAIEFSDLQNSDFLFLNNHILCTKSTTLLIYSLSGKFLHKLKTSSNNDQLLFLSHFNNSLISISPNSVFFYKYSVQYSVLYSNNTLFYTKLNHKNKLFIHSPTNNFFKSLEISNFSLFSISNKQLCFIQLYPNSTTITLCNHNGLYASSCNIPITKIVGISILTKDTVLAMTNHHYYLINISDSTILYNSNSKTINCPVSDLSEQSLNSPHLHTFVKLQTFNNLGYIITNKAQLLIINDQLTLISIVQLPISPVSTISQFLINHHNIAILSNFQLFIINNNAPYTLILMRHDIQDVALHNDPQVASLEKQKLQIIPTDTTSNPATTPETLLIDGNILLQFNDYVVTFLNYEDLPISNSNKSDSILHSYTCQSYLLCTSIAQVPNSHYNLFKLMAISYLKQGDFTLALEASKNARNWELLQFVKGLIKDTTNKDKMGDIYAFLGDISMAIQYYTEFKQFDKIAQLLLENGQYVECMNYIQYMNDPRVLYDKISAYYYRQGQYQQALSIYKKLDNMEMAIKCAYYSRDQDELARLNGLHLIHKMTAGHENQIVGDLVNNLKSLVISDPMHLKYKYYLQQDYVMLKIQHYYNLALLCAKQQKYENVLSYSLAWLCNEYNSKNTTPAMINNILLVRGIAAYHCKLFNTSAGCFGRLGIKVIFKNTTSGEDRMTCVYCQNSVMISSTCGKCGKMMEFDENGQMIKNNLKRVSCGKCGIVTSGGQICKVCHYITK